MERQPSRRAALGALASLPALALLPAASSSRAALEGLIETYRAARAAFLEAAATREAAGPDETTAVIPGLGGKTYRVRGGWDTIRTQIEEDVAWHIGKLGAMSKMFPELVEPICARLDRDAMACRARVDEVFADYLAADDAYNEAIDAEQDALMAICAHRCASIEEAAIRARYIKGSAIISELQPEHLDALFASFLPEGEAIAA